MGNDIERFISELPYVMSVPHANFQLAVAFILAITSITCFIHTRCRSVVSVGLFLFAVVLVQESFEGITLMSEDSLKMLTFVIAAQLYLIGKITYKRFLCRFGRKYMKPKWCEKFNTTLFPTVFAGLVLSVFSIVFFLVVH